jgi:catechol-2,3-dioxygenase
MAAWWAALLDVEPQSPNARTTTITGSCLRVVIERSQIALDYHPEASGVTAINLALGDLREVHRTVNRLAQLGSHPDRATRHGEVTALWFRDPNGAEVALYLPAAVANHAADVLSEELNPKTVLAHVSRTTRQTSGTSI